MKIEPPKIPNLPEINLEQEEEKTSTAKPAGIISTSDVVEAAKSNPLADQLQAAEENEGNTGEEGLNPEQQNLVSKFHPENENLQDASFFLKDARSTNEDRKNSGLQAPFAASKTPDSEQMAKVKESQEKAQDLLTQQTTVQEGGAKDFSNDPLLTGTNLHDAVQNAVDDRSQDLFAALGVQTGADRLKNAADATAAGPQHETSVGKDQLAWGEETKSERKNSDGSTTSITDGWRTNDDGTTSIYHNEFNDGTGITHNVTTTYYKDKKEVRDFKGWTTEDFSGATTGQYETETITTTQADGTVTVNTKETSNPFGGQLTTKMTETTTITTETTEKSAPEAKSYDFENYQANLPPALQKLQDYFKQQAMALNPQTGPGNVDPGSEGDESGGGVDSKTLAYRALILSGVGSGDNLIGPTGPQPDGGTGPGSVSGDNGTLSGGNIDYGPDSDQVGYTGTTHQDDPGDIQFGPKEPVAGTPDSKSTDDSQAASDPSVLHTLLENVWKLDPSLLSRFFASLKKSQ